MDQQIRVAVVDARALWDGVRRGHPALEADACAQLVELLAATLLLHSRGGFAERLQVLVRSEGRARAMVSDAWPDGMVRGFLDVGDPGPWLKGPGLFQVMRSGPSEPYVGKLPLEEGSLAFQFESYLQQSEQIQASLMVWCDPATGDGGGLLVEPLPACPPERLQRLVDALEGLEVVPLWERTPDFLMEWLSQGQGVERLSSHVIDYRCRCSRQALVQVMKGFPAAQIDDLFAPGDPVEVHCDYCGKTYAIHRQDVQSHGAEA